MCIRDRYQRRVHGNLDRIILSSMLLSLFKGFNAYTEIFVFGVVIKLLLIPTYHSTDFEVHRNWLAITHSLPIDKWYFEATSIWTLDYPPFFAYYEWILSKIAYLVDKKMLIVDNLEYKAPACIYFQRITVIVAEIVFMYCLIRVIRVLTAQTGSERLARNQAFAFFFAFLQVGYILVDSIHFQYNTPLMGLLLLSCSFIIERQYIKGSLVYAILLNFKHIYIYASLVIFVFYLSRVCFDDKWRFKFMSFVKVGISVAGVFVLSLLAFLNATQLAQIFKRLFPFQRGLVHEYWAPNFWAPYLFVDKILSAMCGILKWSQTCRNPDADVDQLPNISPPTTMLLIIIASLPLLYKVWRHRDPTRILEYCSVGTFIFYMLGFHVHEKAILIPLSLLQVASLRDPQLEKLAFLLSYGGVFGLFTLLYEEREAYFKVALFIAYHIAYYYFSLSGDRRNRLNVFAKAYLILGAATVQLTYGILQGIFFKRLTFLPLMMFSLYSFSINFYVLVKLYIYVLRLGNPRADGKDRVKANQQYLVYGCLDLPTFQCVVCLQG
eukprot:TRINITY_DN5377_c0_g2_i4.p1 TRINITY_DN5377_c0_g2~~TRINITY_DN5377_c0_g2_i4.p1  ORF type:complete len:571 (+),score=73.84 TRINITY_DN5377_c0_g2_i4:61-1713(+)